MVEFKLQKYQKDRLRKNGMSDNDIKRIINFVREGNWYYGLCSLDLSYRIIIRKYSWKIEVFSYQTVLKNERTKLKYYFKVKGNKKNDFNVNPLGWFEETYGIWNLSFIPKDGNYMFWNKTKLYKMRLYNVYFDRDSKEELRSELDINNWFSKEYQTNNKIIEDKIKMDSELDRFTYRYSSYKKFSNDEFNLIMNNYEKHRIKIGLGEFKPIFDSKLEYNNWITKNYNDEEKKDKKIKKNDGNKVERMRKNNGK